MIQSDKFDSLIMDIKRITNIVAQFAINRLIEILAVGIVIIGVLFLISLISYSPEDPNFIFPENTQIKNYLGFQGSFVSDLFLQSVGLISYLISITFIFTGINIFKSKNIFLIVENIFFIILYSIFGSLFLSFFYRDTFALYINGQGGFVGNYFTKSFIGNLINLNPDISYYILILIVTILFFISINFNIKNLLNFLKKIIHYVRKDKNKNYTEKSEIISEYIPQDEIKNLIQEDLPFIKAEKIKENEKQKFKLPNLDILK